MFARTRGVSALSFWSRRTNAQPPSGNACVQQTARTAGKDPYTGPSVLEKRIPDDGPPLHVSSQFRKMRESVDLECGLGVWRDR